MLIQSLIVIATMLALAGAILTSTLVSAKAVLHQTMLTKAQTAMSDATAAFVEATKKSVRLYGTQPAAWPVAAPMSEPICESYNGKSICPYLATISWAVTGSSDTLISKAKATNSADAAYLANTVDEQRISATLSVQVSDATGTDVFVEHSREITARILNAAPYVAITATRDLASQAGSTHASEGDSAGALSQSARTVNLYLPSPNPSNPAAFTDTRILTSIDCSNSLSGSTAYIGNGYFDPSIHPYGNVSWHNESSCLSGAEATVGTPTGYIAPTGSLFVAQPADPDTFWNKGDESASDFSR